MSGTSGRGGQHANGYRPAPRPVTRLSGQPPRASHHANGGGNRPGRPSASSTNDPMMKKPVFNGARGQTAPTPTVRSQSHHFFLFQNGGGALCLIFSLVQKVCAQFLLNTSCIIGLITSPHAAKRTANALQS